MAITEPWTSGSPDVVSGGGPGGGRSLAHRVAAVVVVALVLGGVIWLTNRQLSGREVSAVLSCVQTSERTLTDIDEQLAVTAKYVAPQVGPDSSLLVRDDLYRLIEDAAADAVPALDNALAGCQQVAIAPPYHRLSAARLAYVSYLDAQLAHLQDITRDGTAQARIPPELAPLRAKARAALLAAVGSRHVSVAGSAA